MIKADYHIHSFNSFDGKSSVKDICSAAVSRGIKEVCFTEHFSVCDFDPSYRVLDYDLYSSEIDEARQTFDKKLIIKKGIESGEPHVKKDEIRKWLEGRQLDMIIGSVHNIGSQKLRIYLQGKTPEEAYRKYFETLWETVKQGELDIIGHFDVIKKYVYKYHSQNYDFLEYRDLIKSILLEALNRGIGLEINTSGLNHEVKEIFPGMEVLKLYRELGGEIVTVGSDSHSSYCLGKNISTAAELLEKCNFPYYCIFTDRKPEFIKIDK